ncbi:RNA transcription, translation and transport factor protein [Pogonomyrmex barbatus]|uniref:RNA transcription, translation and transport factor protein n=1 Tax=Pogonomyrmex barbatus TaxID=144034 RepID=A0A6I9WMZ9_9HYME|nr:RNA transcription, translation and transport factor protein [Pogonomyrmex barbatus]
MTNMFERKLKALGYLDWKKTNGNDTDHFRRVIIWLEDQKIRHYTPDDRKKLRDITSPEWPNTFEKYCNDVECPLTNNEIDRLEWLIGYAIQLEFGDDCSKYQQVVGKKAKNKKEIKPIIKSTNPLDNLDFNSDAFKTGVNSIAKLLNIPKHSNHLVTLEACSKLVCKKLNADAIKQSNNTVNTKGKTQTKMIIGPSFNMGDAMLDNAAKGLSLLYIQDLRDLQTSINETIVAVQNITANPKTDTKLGKVGK